MEIQHIKTCGILPQQCSVANLIVLNASNKRTISSWHVGKASNLNSWKAKKEGLQIQDQFVTHSKTVLKKRQAGRGEKKGGRDLKFLFHLTLQGTIYVKKLFMF